MLKSASEEPIERCSVLPEPRFAELGPVLAQRLEQVATRTITPWNFGSLLDTLMQEVFQHGLTAAGAHEGTIWLLDPEEQNLIPAYNTGLDADRFVGTFRQPLNQGLVCMVFASEQPFVENDVYKNTRQSRQLDSLLQKQTHALIALPFYFLKNCRGVVSCVQLGEPERQQPARCGFTHVHLAEMQRTVGILSRLLEYQLLGRTVGWQTDS